MGVEVKTVYKGNTGSGFKARSVQDDVLNHFSVLDALSEKIDELHEMPTMPVLMTWNAR